MRASLIEESFNEVATAAESYRKLRLTMEQTAKDRCLIAAKISLLQQLLELEGEHVEAVLH